ncbi:MAG: hypothetical protein ABIK44_07105, partial [candidate division WOR-3 bacterium]
LPKRVDEIRQTRGFGWEQTLDRFQLLAAISYVGRDAELNPDGTVLRLAESGVHDDSASLAEENLVRELLLGTAALYRSGRVILGACCQFIRFNRIFTPRDSQNSFSGQQLAGCGVSLGWKTDAYQLAGDWAIASTGGQAGALRLGGTWSDIVTRITLRGYQHHFFAPHGRV